MPVPFSPGTYAAQLLYLGHGLPMWKPGPPRVTGVLIGDVGFIEDGRFCPLFNTTLPESHPIHIYALPSDHQPLPLDYENEVLKDKKYMKPGTYCSGHIKVSSPTDPSDKRIHFSCTRPSGAMLVLGDYGVKEEVLPNKSWGMHLLQNDGNWLEYARKDYLGLRRGDLILIRGTVKTTMWKSALVLDKKAAYATSGDINAPISKYFCFTPASQIVQYREGKSFVEWGALRRFGKGPYQSAPSSEDLSEEGDDYEDSEGEEGDLDHQDVNEEREEHVPEIDSSLRKLIPNQCVFLKYYQVRYRALLPPVCIEGGAEPSGPENTQDGKGSAGVAAEGFTSAGQAAPDDVVSEFRTPMDELLDYILENTDAEVALVCDSDIEAVCKGCEFPEDFSTFLKQSAPRLYVDNAKVGTLYLDTYLPTANSVDSDIGLASCFTPQTESADFGTSNGASSPRSHSPGSGSRNLADVATSPSAYPHSTICVDRCEGLTDHRALGCSSIAPSMPKHTSNTPNHGTSSRCRPYVPRSAFHPNSSMTTEVFC